MYIQQNVWYVENYDLYSLQIIFVPLLEEKSDCH